MTREELRLECAKLSMTTGLVNPDMDLVVAKAKRLFDFVVEETGKPPSIDPDSDGQTQVRTSTKKPRHPA